MIYASCVLIRGRAMLPRLCAISACAGLLASVLFAPEALAQKRVRTETIRVPPGQASQPPVVPVEPPAAADGGAAAGGAKSAGPLVPARPKPQPPEIIADASQLPAPVRATRERILAAAHSGDLQKLFEVMQSGNALPQFSSSQEKNPLVLWRATYPESGGIEVLSILITILDTGCLHVDAGTPQEMYVWPYFARGPLKALKPDQKVDLLRIVTGTDYKSMVESGTYNFYRVGISPDGRWHYFVAGD
jgi:hypothetical protein